MSEFFDSTKGLFLKGLLIWAIAIGVPIYLANNIFSNYHLKQILNSVERSENAMEKFNDSLVLTKTEGNCYRAGKRVGRVYCGIELDGWVKTQLAPAAEKLRTELVWQSYSLSTVEPFPFGGEFAEPIERYRDHMKAWIKQLSGLEKCTTTACASEAFSLSSDVSSSFRISEVALRKVLPTPSYFGSEGRISRIFEK